MKIKNGDKVVVIAGKEKGKTGIVKDINPKKDVVFVDGLNIRTHHVKPTQQNPDGGIMTKEGPIHISNVMINIAPSKSKDKIKVSKIGYKITINNKGKKQKTRISRANNQEI